MTSFVSLDLDSVPEPECRKLGRAAHRIEGFAVVSIAHGELMLRLADGEGTRLLEGDLLIVPEGTHVEARGRESEAEVLLLWIPARWMVAAFSLAGASQSRGLPKRVAIQRAPTDLARRGVRLLRRISAEPELSAIRAPLRFVSTVLELVSLGGEAEPGVAKPVFFRRTRTDSLLEALAAVQSEPLEDLSLPTLAARLAVSERQVSRLFQEHVGMSFRTWATELRLERARRLLAETDLPIIDVAGETGWSSLAHFNSVFRRRAGSTPTGYRILHRTALASST
ncbi:MAG TPA: AraC family transcriptional regulator [Myxococcota bacterium]|nr:AraC family transcriptional regulator [Myxococcota bacterium]